jgi:hypothetical protein
VSVPHMAGTDFDVCVPAKKAEVEAGSGVIVSHKDGRCVYLAERNLVACPMGKTPYPSFYTKSTKRGVYCNREACKRWGKVLTQSAPVVEAAVFHGFRSLLAETDPMPSADPWYRSLAPAPGDRPLLTS